MPPKDTKELIEKNLREASQNLIKARDLIHQTGNLMPGSGSATLVVEKFTTPEESDRLDTLRKLEKQLYEIFSELNQTINTIKTKA